MSKDKISFDIDANGVLPCAVQSNSAMTDDDEKRKLEYILDAEYARAVILRDVAESVKDSFIKDMCDIAEKGDGIFDGGENNSCVVKGEESTQRKLTSLVKENIATIGTSYAPFIGKMWDILRGTIVVKSYDNMVNVVVALENKARTCAWKIYVDNKFENPNATSYVGLHFRIMYTPPWVP
jgi:hypothetical protein